MFFFQSFHDEDQSETPAVDAQTHIPVLAEPLPVVFVFFVFMDAIDHHDAIVFLENQRVVVDKGLQSSVKFRLPVFLGQMFQHLGVKVKNKRRMETEIPLRLSQIFEIADNHLFLDKFDDRCAHPHEIDAAAEFRNVDVVFACHSVDAHHRAACHVDDFNRGVVFGVEAEAV